MTQTFILSAAGGANRHPLLHQPLRLPEKTGADFRFSVLQQCSVNVTGNQLYHGLYLLESWYSEGEIPAYFLNVALK